MVILSASVMWLISCATRWLTGAVEVTHGQLLSAAARVPPAPAARAGAQAAGSATSAARAAAPTIVNRHLRCWNFHRLLATLPQCILAPPRRVPLPAARSPRLVIDKPR